LERALHAAIDAAPVDDRRPLATRDTTRSRSRSDPSANARAVVRSPTPTPTPTVRVAVRALVVDRSRDAIYHIHNSELGDASRSRAYARLYRECFAAQAPPRFEPDDLVYAYGRSSAVACGRLRSPTGWRYWS
jgi:hypothetical protein